MTTTSTSSLAASHATPDRGLYAVAAAAFAGSAVATVVLCRSMSGGMEMPGGWTMSMAWMKMPGQSWPGAALMFMHMWLVMMIAMMTPSLVPMLARYRGALRRRGENDLLVSTLVAALAYFGTWQLVGIVAYPLGALVAAAAMQSTEVSRAIPVLSAVVLGLSGVTQLSSWKMRKLQRCRDPDACASSEPGGVGGAFEHGMGLGWCCASCCTGFMSALLVLGVMDGVVMALIATALTSERVMPHPRWAVRLSGVTMLALAAAILGKAAL
jgi:predicted metal-binding membrane protein